MNISLTKQYTTRSGLPIKLYDIISENNKQTYPVIGAFYDESRCSWQPASWNTNGKSSQFTCSQLDLIEVPTHNFVKDQLVWVWNKESEHKRIRFFSRMSEHGIYYVFKDGHNSKSTEETASYNFCEPYYPTQESKSLRFTQGELVVVWDNSDERYYNPANKYAIRRFHHEVSPCKYSVTNQEGEFDDEPNYWDNCVRLSEFKL